MAMDDGEEGSAPLWQREGNENEGAARGGADEGVRYGGEEADAVVRRCKERKGIEGCAREEMGIDGRCGRIVGSSPWRRACVRATCEGIGCSA